MFDHVLRLKTANDCEAVHTCQAKSSTRRLDPDRLQIHRRDYPQPEGCIPSTRPIPNKGTGITPGRVGSLLASLSIRSLTKQQRGTPDVRAIKATLRGSAAGMDDLA
jgi:hypothetical protein